MIPTNLSVLVKKKSRRNSLVAKQEAHPVSKIAAMHHSKVRELVKEQAMLVEVTPTEKAKIETTAGTIGIDPIMVNRIPGIIATAPIPANRIPAITATAPIPGSRIRVLKGKIAGHKLKVEHH